MELTTSVEAPGSYRIIGWTGDADSHEPISHDPPRPYQAHSCEKYDVVVIGAGLSGLTAAFKLRHTDMLVLEQAAETGGQARSGYYRGIEFNLGSAYLVDLGGKWGELYDELGLNPKPVIAPVDSWWHDGQWLEGFRRASPSVLRLQGAGHALNEMKKALLAITASGDFPKTPYETSTSRALKLDAMSFAQWLKPYAHPDVMRLLDTYCYSSFGASAEIVSAYAGINFCSEFLSPIYAFPGGNSHVAKAMVNHIHRAGAGRIRTDCRLYKISLHGADRAIVHYLREGEPHAAEAKRVVLAVPYEVVGRVIARLTPVQQHYLSQPRCAPYLVTNLCFDQLIPTETYQHWLTGCQPFTDFTSAARTHDLMDLKSRRNPCVITVFTPFQNSVNGRERLLRQSPADFAHPLVESFERLFPGSKRQLREVHMTRWRRPLLINRPGIFMHWLPRVRKRLGPLFLAHSDGQGLPSIESATWEGMSAAQQVLQSLARQSKAR